MSRIIPFFIGHSYDYDGRPDDGRLWVHTTLTDEQIVACYNHASEKMRFQILSAFRKSWGPRKASLKREYYRNLCWFLGRDKPSPEECDTEFTLSLLVATFKAIMNKSMANLGIEGEFTLGTSPPQPKSLNDILGRENRVFTDALTDDFVPPGGFQDPDWDD